jgi:hypothetical protein
MAKARLLLDGAKTAQAKDVLLQGNAATEGKSTEIHYFLGLVLIDLHDYDEAQKHAIEAYALGHPLPGLKDKLAAAGYPIDYARVSSS